MKDLTISLEDSPGTLATVGEALGKAGINIEGGCGISHEGRGVIHIAVEDAAGARTALEGAGIKVEGEADVITFDFAGREDAPGSFGQVARKIADAGVNITLAYLATRSRAVLATSDNQKARQAIS
jgi:hypothetical protein